MSKDVILDRYGRLFEIPYQMARLGHDVQGFCLSYRKGIPQGEWVERVANGALRWCSEGVSPLVLPSLIQYPTDIYRRLKKFKPDLIIGASDIPHVILAGLLARKIGAAFVVDLYDNFEGFGQARFPGAVGFFRRSVRSADLVLTTSEPLTQFVLAEYAVTGKVVTMPSTVDLERFRRRDPLEARAALGLPLDARLIGTAGGLTSDKGIDCLYQAWQHIETMAPDAHLVLAGPHGTERIPEGNRVHYLGSLPHDQVALLFSALDVGAICIRDTLFGRYCFPQKAYEMLSCGLPVVAANIGAMKALFADCQKSLYRVDDPVDLAEKIILQLDARLMPMISVNSWEQVIHGVEPFMNQLVAKNRH